MPAPQRSALQSEAGGNGDADDASSERSCAAVDRGRDARAQATRRPTPSAPKSWCPRRRPTRRRRAPSCRDCRELRCRPRRGWSIRRVPTERRRCRSCCSSRASPLPVVAATANDLAAIRRRCRRNVDAFVAGRDDDRPCYPARERVAEDIVVRGLARARAAEAQVDDLRRVRVRRDSRHGEAGRPGDTVDDVGIVSRRICRARAPGGCSPPSRSPRAIGRCSSSPR